MLTPDTMLHIPTSPYSNPLNFNYMCEYEGYGCLFTVSRLYFLYSSQLRIENYIVNNDYYFLKITSTLMNELINPRTCIFKEDRYYDCILAAVPNVFG